MKRRATYHHGDLPEALLQAADALIAEKGASGFSLREAARRVGVDPAACYRHFRDKDAILQALARRGFTRLAAWMADAVKGLRAPERMLLALGRAYVDFALTHPSSFRAMFGPTGEDARDSDLLRGAYPDHVSAYERLRACLRAWADARACRIDVEEASVILWSSVHGLAWLLMEGALRPPEGHTPALVDAAVRTVLAGLDATSPGTRAG